MTQGLHRRLLNQTFNSKKKNRKYIIVKLHETQVKPRQGPNNIFIEDKNNKISNGTIKVS